MRLNEIKEYLKMSKRGNIGGQVITIFILVLVISLVVGFTFLFTAQLKTQVQTTSGSQQTTAYQAVNNTENAGSTVVSYIPLIFLALIFSGLLYLIIRMVAPFIGGMGGGMGA